jgi:plasmid stabilization system protein ParE
VRLRWSRPAVDDLVEVRRFIAADNPRAATDTVARIRRSAMRILEFPNSGAPLGMAELRVATVPGTPFRLFYRVKRDAILIVAVWHGARQWPPARD